MVVGTKVAVRVTGTPTVRVPGATNVIVFPLEDANMTSWGEVLDVALALPPYEAWKK